MFASMYDGPFFCTFWGHEYAEYVNGCPRCMTDFGVRCGVVRRAEREAAE